MYDLTDLEKWRLVAGGIKFVRPEPRRVRIEILAEEATSLFVDKVFIGYIEGYEVIQFAVPGAFTLTAKGGPCKIWTPELENAGAVEIPEAISFTKIMQRRTRNPELELMMKKMGDNMERRIAQVTRDAALQAALQARIAAREENQAAAERARAEEAERVAKDGEPGDEEEPVPVKAGVG